MLKQNDTLFWYHLGSPLGVKILKRNQSRTTELKINQQGGMWREMRGDRKRKREGCDLSREKMLHWLKCLSPAAQAPQKAESPFTISTFSFIRSPPHLLLSVWNRLVMIPFAAGRRAGLLNRTLQAHIHIRTHTHNHIFTPLHSPLSLTYTQP